MANPVRKPIDIVAQLDAIAAKDPVSQLSIKRRAAVQPDASWLTNSSPLAPAGRTSNLLAQLDANPYIKKDLPAPPKPGAGASALKHLLMPLQILDTPRRAIISGIREIVDTMDSDPNTKASLGDFLNQTKQFDYGFGKAFPMKGWAGRIVGLIGDVALDPITWATLGGTIVAKGTVKMSGTQLSHLIEGGVYDATAEQLAKVGVKRLGEDVFETSARSAVFGVKASGRAAAKTVIGREGRQKLAFFTQQRMEWMTKNGVANFSKEEIASAFRNIALQGKQNVPDIIAKELGIRGPGVYYFGSRVKVPGTDVVGKFLERGITRTRLGFVQTRGINALHRAITPRGVGAIEYFGEGTIREFRVGLANGSLSDSQAQMARLVLNGDDVRRIRFSEADFDAVQRMGSLREEVMRPENNPVRHLLDNVKTEDMPAQAAILGVSPEHLELAQKFRGVLEELHVMTDDAWHTVVPDHVLGHQQGYLPHNTTTQGVELMDEVRADPAMAGLLPDDGSALHIVGNFRQRGLKAGSPFFGEILDETDLTIDRLNEIVNVWLRSNNRPVFDFFDTDMKNIVPAYIRGHANMMSNVAMMNEFKKTPEFVKLVEGYFGISPEYLKQMHKNSAYAFEQVLTSIQNLHSGLRSGLDVLDRELTKTYGSLDAALTALRTPGVSQADVDVLFGHLQLAIADAAEKNAKMVAANGDVADLLPSVDGLGVHGAVGLQAKELDDEFMRISAVAVDLGSAPDPSSFEVAQLIVDLNKYTEDVVSHGRSQVALMDMSSHLGPFGRPDGSKNTLYDEVLKIVRVLRKDSVPASRKYGRSIEQIETDLVRLYSSGVSDSDTLLPVFNSLSSYMKDSYPKLSEKIDEIFDGIRASILPPSGPARSPAEVASLSKASSVASQRAATAEAKAARLEGFLKDLADAETEVVLHQKKLAEAKETLSRRIQWHNSVKKAQAGNAKGLHPTREMALNAAEAVRSAGDEVTAQRKIIEDLTVELGAKKRSVGSAKVKASVVDAKQARSIATKNAAHSAKVTAQYQAALDSVKSVQQVAASYNKGLESLQVLVMHQKTSAEISHLREVMAYYGVELGDSISKAIYDKNLLALRNSGFAGDATQYFNDLFRVDMEIIDLQKIADDLELRLSRRPLAGPKVPAVSAAEKVSPSTAAKQKRLSELMQSPEYDMAKSVENRTRTFTFLSAIEGHNVDWTFGGRVKPPTSSPAQNLGGDSPLTFNRSQWNGIFREHTKAGKIASIIIDWAHTDEVLKITNPVALERDGLDNITHERSLSYFIDYLKSIDDVDLKYISATDVANARSKIVNDHWTKSGDRRLLKEVERLDASVIAEDITTAPVVRIKDAQVVVAKTIDSLQAEKAVLQSEKAVTDAGLTYNPVVLNDAFNELDASTEATYAANALEIATTDARATRDYGQAVDAATNDVTSITAEGPVDYSSLKKAEQRVGYGKDDAWDGIGKRAAEDISPEFEVEFKNSTKAADALDDVFNMGTLATRSREQLNHEIDVLTKMHSKKLETSAVPRSQQLAMIRSREAILNPPPPVRKPTDNLPHLRKLAKRPKTLDNGTVIMVDHYFPTALGTYRKHEDGRWFFRAEDMTGYKDPWVQARRERGKWVEVRVRNVSSSDFKLPDTEKARLGFFTKPINEADPDGPKRWLKYVDESDDQWIRSDSFDGFSSEQANSFGGTIESIIPPDPADSFAPLMGEQARKTVDMYSNPPGKFVKDQFVPDELGAGIPARPMTATEEGLARLEQDLKSLTDSANATAADGKKARAANATAQQLVTDLQNQFDSVKGLVQPHDPVSIKKLEDRILEVRNLINRTQRGVEWNRGINVNKTVRKLDGSGKKYYNISMPVPSGRTEVRNRIAGISDVSKRYNFGVKTLDEGIEMLRTMGTRGPGFEHLEQIAIRQMKLQVEFEAAVAVLEGTDVERRLMEGLQNSIFTMEQAGHGQPGQVINKATGLIEGSFPSSNVSKFFPDLEDGWEYLSKGVYGAGGIKGDHGIYPGLAGSPEFVELWNKAKRFDDPEYLRQMHKYVGSYTKFFKAYATMTPGFHVRNGMANAVKLVFMGAEWKNMTEATPLYIDWMKAAKNGVQYEDWVLTKPLEIREVLRISRKSMFGSGGGIFTVDFKDAVGGSRLWDNKLVRFNAKWGQESDNYSRFVLGFDSAKSGMDVGMAQARTKRAFFDYEDLSQVDEVMRQIIPFWLWTSRNLIFELQNQWLNPKPYQIYRSIMRNMRDPDYEPSEYPSKFIKEMGGIKLPFGDSLYLAPDLGFTRTPQQLEELFNPIRYSNNSNPLLKIPLEQFLGRSVFTGQTLDTPKERLIHILKGLVPPVQMGDRLLGGQGDAAKNAWLSTIGSPVRTYQTKEK